MASLCVRHKPEFLVFMKPCNCKNESHNFTWSQHVIFKVSEASPRSHLVSSFLGERVGLPCPQDYDVVILKEMLKPRYS